MRLYDSSLCLLRVRKQSLTVKRSQNLICTQIDALGRARAQRTESHYVVCRPCPCVGRPALLRNEQPWAHTNSVAVVLPRVHAPPPALSRVRRKTLRCTFMQGLRHCHVDRRYCTVSSCVLYAIHQLASSCSENIRCSPTTIVVISA